MRGNVVYTKDSVIKTNSRVPVDSKSKEVYQNRVERIYPGMTISEAEKLLILITLEYTRQNRTRAAELLGISIRTLRNKINIYKNKEFI